MIILPVSAIANPGHVSFLGTAEEGATTFQRIEVYTGWIDFTFDRVGKLLADEAIQTYLPVSRNTLAEYQSSVIVTQAVSASPSAWINEEDEVNAVNVSAGLVHMASRTFDYIKKEPFNVLILNLTIAASRLSLRGISYNITLCTSLSQTRADRTLLKNPEHTVRDDEVPDTQPG